jgi:Protein of unknown function (DUF2917)
MPDTTSLALQGSPAAVNSLPAFAEVWRSAREREGLQLQIALGPWRAWSLDVRGGPIEISLLEGEVMVTFEGDAADHVLVQGGAFRTPRRGRVAVLAFRPSRFSVAAG